MVFPAAIILNPTINLIIRSLRAIRAIRAKRNMYQMMHTRELHVFNATTIFRMEDYFYPAKIADIEKFASLSIRATLKAACIVILLTVHVIITAMSIHTCIDGWVKHLDIDEPY